ncbi:PREDICTED: uncharacterized protein LOC104759525 [Camelina sativa]|uniref:Uncharacterized protein LOC104759525 n=1 Tax=Camelina sativa TaxID=90675 RepID=A0ABM0X4W7_CAMSA|nr:PREDICTED: uncharacterized protein LOC104759525 [Camelina sativa]
MKARKLQSIKISNRSPEVNHLLSADDSLFFTLANVKFAKKIKEILSLYEKVLGQAGNLVKSSITFGKKVKVENKTKVRHILNIHNEGEGGKYLGIPEQFGRKKSTMFQYIIEKVKEKTQGWNKKFLSSGGKKVLLKSVALAIPIYSMNVFKFPKENFQDINSCLAKFWWNSSESNNSMHWLAWERLGTPKRSGGLGFRDLELFNDALLGKQSWRLMQQAHSLMVKLPSDPPRPPRPRGNIIPTILSEWNMTTPTSWNTEKLTEQVHPDDLELIQRIKLYSQDNYDILGGHYTKTGIYPVKLSYHLAVQLD